MYINETHKNKVEERGYIYIATYEKYDYTLDKNKYIKDMSNGYMRVKCPYCGMEYDVLITGFIYKKQSCRYCCRSYEKSFAYYIEVELGESLDKYWDFEKNKENPYYISKGTKNKVWIKCTKKDYHGSYEISCSNFVLGKRCSYCGNHKTHPLDSFAQYHIDNTDPDFINKYWSDRNIIDLWNIAPNSTKIIWIKCQEKDYHGDYKTDCHNFTLGNRCPYCNPFASHKVHKKDSFGYLHPEKLKYWNWKLNAKNPYEICPNIYDKFWFNCEDCGTPFERSLCNISSEKSSLKCRKCTSSKGEKKIKEYLINHGMIEGIDFICQKKYYGLIGLGGKNLSYDFYFPKLNKLFEYQGEYHDGTVSYQTEDEFLKQQEHDRRKREYAENHNIELLEIWYWDYDNIEKILDNIFK